MQFELHEAYAIDILVSTGDGKVRVHRAGEEGEGCALMCRSLQGQMYKEGGAGEERGLKLSIYRYHGVC